MKIGIDIDEVTLELVDAVVKFYDKKTKQKFKKKDFYTYSWWDILGISKKEVISVLDEFYKSNQHDKVKPVKDAISSINYLSENHKIFFITARSPYLKSYLVKWFNKYFPNKKFAIIFTQNNLQLPNGAKTKTEICKSLGIKIMLEDSRKESVQCAEAGILTILFDKPWNQNISHKNIKRVSTWKQAIKLIKTMTKTSQFNHNNN